MKTFFLFILGVAMASCCRKAAVTKTVVAADTAAVTPVTPVPTQGLEKTHQKATVIYLELDGCRWLLQLENGEKLEPINLTEEYQKKDLKLWIRYEEMKEMGSTCMVGKIVKLTDIIRR